MSSEDGFVRCTLCENCGHELTTRSRQFTQKDDLRNGRLCSEAEASSLAAAVRDADADLLQYDTQIVRLQETLKLLESQRADLQLYREQSQALISPIRQLPVEILAEIFSFVCESTHSLKITQKRVSPTTLNLSRVCSRWRQVAISAPLLWCKLFIDLSTQAHGALDVLKLYAKRSQGTDIPWRLSIICSAETRDSEEDPNYDSFLRYADSIHESSWMLLDVLLSQSYQWRDVTIKASWPILGGFGGRIDGREGKLPLLETLKLHWIPGRIHQNSTAAYTLRYLGNAPRLRSLSIPEFQYWFQFSYKQLTSFGTLENWSYHDILYLLRICPNVQDIVIVSNTMFNAPDESELFSIPLISNIRSLTVESMRDSNGVLDLLRSLTLPRLTTLILGGFLTTNSYTTPYAHPLSDVNGWEEAVIDLIHRSQCPLQELNLFDGSFQSEDALLSLCRAVPSLTRLGFTASGADCELSNTFFEALTVTGTGHDAVLHHLKELFVDIDDGFMLLLDSDKPLLSPEVIVSMAESRSGSAVSTYHSQVAPLESLEIVVEESPEGGYWTEAIECLGPRIHALKEAGIRSVYLGS